MVPERDGAVATADDDRIRREVEQPPFLPQPRGLGGDLLDVDQHHHRSVDTVVCRAVGVNAQHVMAPFAIGHLTLEHLHRIDHLDDHRFQIGNVDRGLQVVDWPPDIAREYVEELRRRRCQPADAQVDTHGDHRQAGAVDQIGDVVVQPRELGVACLKLLVDGGELLVDRLQLLLRRLQLFVGALQLLVG